MKAPSRLRHAMNHYLTLTGIGIVEYALKDNTYDEDDAYNKNENLLHYLRVALGISGVFALFSKQIVCGFFHRVQIVLYDCFDF